MFYIHAQHSNFPLIHRITLQTTFATKFGNHIFSPGSAWSQPGAIPKYTKLSIKSCLQIEPKDLKKAGVYLMCIPNFFCIDPYYGEIMFSCISAFNLHLKVKNRKLNFQPGVSPGLTPGQPGANFDNFFLRASLKVGNIYTNVPRSMDRLKKSFPILYTTSFYILTLFEGL